MAKSNNPFGDFSFENMMKQIQDNPMMKAWQDNDFYQSMAKTFSQNGSTMDLSELWDLQKKNLSTLNEVNMNLGDRMTKLASHQAELMSEAWRSVEEYSSTAQNMDADAASKNMEYAQSVFQKAMGNMQDLSKEGMEMSAQTAQVLQNRMQESVSELQDLMAKFQK